jgi:hypothetical protein
MDICYPERTMRRYPDLALPQPATYLDEFHRYRLDHCLLCNGLPYYTRVSFQKVDGHLIFAGFLFLGNRAFFIIIGFNPFLSSSTIGDIRGLEIVTYFDFGALGNFIA